MLYSLRMLRLPKLALVSQPLSVRPEKLARWAALLLVLACIAWVPAAAQSGVWTWMGGSSTVPGSNEGQPGVYGVLGTPAAANIPGGRGAVAQWQDQSGNIWLFGGYGFDANGAVSYLNDLWELDPTTNEWAWMSGSTTIGKPAGASRVCMARAGYCCGGQRARRPRRALKLDRQQRQSLALRRLWLRLRWSLEHAERCLGVHPFNHGMDMDGWQQHHPAPIFLGTIGRIWHAGTGCKGKPAGQPLFFHGVDRRQRKLLAVWRLRIFGQRTRWIAQRLVEVYAFDE